MGRLCDRPARLNRPGVYTLLLAGCLALVAGQPGPARGQEGDPAPVRGRRCATAPAEVKEVAAAGRKLMAMRAKKSGGRRNTVVPIAWHVLHQGASGNLSRRQIENQVDVLNAAYADTGLRFRLESVGDVDSREWFRMTIGSKNEKKALARLCKRADRVLNIFTCGPQDGTLGWSSFPWARGRSRHCVVVHHGTLPGGRLKPYDLGDTLVHEVGHFFGLFHTFENGCAEPGDSIADTPPEADPSYSCDNSRDSCPGGEVDPVDNFMDYADDACMNRFTPEQKARLIDMARLYRSAMLQ